MNGQAKTLNPSKSVQNAKVRTGTKRERLTQERLKKVLNYNPNTGKFIWLEDRGNKKAGTIAGSIGVDGYIRIRVYGTNYLAHRLASLYMDGYFPEHGMDHKLGVKEDNRWSELRHASQACNMQNVKKHIKNKSGFPGVHWNKALGRWQSRISIRGKRVFIGNYTDILDAALARLTVEMQCDKWTCNHQSELVKAIKAAWPEFITVAAA